MLAPKRKTYENLEERWEVVRGKRLHDAIVEYEPGAQCCGEEELAQAASRGAKQPAYVLWLDDDMPRVQVFIKGRYAGDVQAWPDSVARQLGCTFPTMSGGRGTIDLTPHKAPAPKKGDQRIGRWTVKEWKHMIAHESDWSILLDGAGQDTAKQALAFLDDKKADTRFVAVKMLGAIGYIGDCEFGLGTLANGTYERLREMSTTDADAKVRVAAKEEADDLAERLEEYAVRAELPWIGKNFDKKAIPKALAALDDERDSVRSRVLLWWSFAWEVPKPIGKQVEKKLVALLATVKKRDAREDVERALEHVREKMKA